MSQTNRSKTTQANERNRPPDHGLPTHGSARFLLWVGQRDIDPPLSKLPELYDEWRRRQDSGEQTTLSERWSK